MYIYIYVYIYDVFVCIYIYIYVDDIRYAEYTIIQILFDDIPYR